MKKTLHRIISSVLALVLAASMIRVPVYAVEPEEEIVVTEAETETLEEEAVTDKAEVPEEPDAPGKKEDPEKMAEKVSRFVPGYLPAPNEGMFESVSEEQAAEELFDEDVRFYISPEASRIPSRDQGQFGACWAFGTMAAVEMSALRNKVTLRDGSEANNKIDLSELHLAYFCGKKNEPYNPLGGFEGDTNSVVNSDFLAGGSPDNAVSILASWIGAADEKSYPYVNDPSLRKYETARENAVDDVIHQRGYYIAGLHTAPSAVKALIQKYGSASMIYWSFQNNNDQGLTLNDVYSSENNCYYVPVKQGINHFVSIVGWDDDFPKENFAYSEKPEGDGAWLVRNSWEAGNYVTTDGKLAGNHPELYSYFWLSYYDKTSADECYAFDMERVDKYEHNYQYDGCMTTEYVTGPEKFANIFTATDEPQKLTAVYFATGSANVPYKIDVYKGVSEGQPKSGTRAMPTQEGKLTYAGGYTIELTNPVELEAGERFSVVITVPKGTGMNAEKSSNDSYVTTAHTEDRRSICLDEDTWKTAAEYMNSDQYGDIRIKALTNWSAHVTGVSLAPRMNIKAGELAEIEPEIKPAHAADKSVTWSSSDDSVAYVEYYGKAAAVNAVAKGEADITVTTNDGGFTATCHVIVTDDNNLILYPGESKRLNLSGDGRCIYGAQWSVTASPKNCVSVTNGVVTAKNLPKGTTYGKALVEAVCGSETHTFNITVDASAHENVPITEGGKKTQITAPKTITLNMGTNGKAAVSIPANLRNRADQIDWNRDDIGVCGVHRMSNSSNNSKITFELVPREAGATYIEWLLADEKGNVTKAYTKVIVKKPVTELNLTGNTELAVGVGTRLQVTGTRNNTETKDPVFSVKGKGIKVSKSGYVVATTPGAKGTVTVKSGKASSSIDVEAATPKRYLVLGQTSVTVAAPKSGAKTAKITIASPKKDQPKVKWSITPADLGVTINENGIVSVSDLAKPGLYEVVATPSEEGSGYNTATCELIVK
ncbi:MAG: Ig-like domain-containing protein [Lachnospiraceae bacterium]|nr:Ig-like domain-containing protein [Lachnospiraceae bacterium]